MEKKYLNLVDVAIVIQSLIFILLGVMGNISFVNISYHLSLVIILWIAVLTVVDYASSNDWGHAIKMGIVFTVLWGAIETGIEFALNSITTMDNGYISYIVYGVEAVLFLVTAMAFNLLSEDNIKLGRKIWLVAMFAVLIAFIVVVINVFNSVDTAYSQNIFEEVVNSRSVFDNPCEKMVVIFYGIEGILANRFLKNKSHI